jgi:hypothetical protein
MLKTIKTKINLINIIQRSKAIFVLNLLKNKNKSVNNQ